MLAWYEHIGAHVGSGEIVDGQDLRLAQQFDPLAVRDRLAAEEHPHMARAVTHVNPVTRIAKYWNALLEDVALHDRIPSLSRRSQGATSQTTHEQTFHHEGHEEHEVWEI